MRLFSAVLVVFPSFVLAGDWPQFLGPQRNAVSAEKNLNWNWDQKKPKVLWKVPLGSGYGSFAVVGDRLYAMASRGKRDFIVCLDAKDGRELWKFDAAPMYVDRQRQGIGPRATPTFHDSKLYCQLPMGGLLCLTADGKKKLWEKNILTETGAKTRADSFYWGVSISPLVEGNLVIVQPGGPSGKSVAAFHKETGNLEWTTGDGPIGYASPIAITVDKQRQIIVPTGRTILGIEPAKGETLWSYAFGNQFDATASNPVWADNLLFVSAAYGVGCAALEIVAEGKTWQAREKWKDRKALQTLFATSVIHKGHVYGPSGDLGAIFLRCLDLQTGKQQWDQRLDSRSHLLLVDDHLLVWNQGGSLSVVEARSDRFTLKHEWPDLLTYKSWAAPALANGRLYVRDEKHALCLDLRP